MGWQEKYNETDVIQDLTKPLSKIWDNLMPLSYPFVLEFKTNRVFEVEKIETMGPYHMTHNFIDYDCNVLLDNQPLKDMGWKGEKITIEFAKKAYGENYFFEMRNKMVSLSVYAGIKVSQFDMGGPLHMRVEDFQS